MRNRTIFIIFILLLSLINTNLYAKEFHLIGNYTQLDNDTGLLKLNYSTSSEIQIKLTNAKELEGFKNIFLDLIVDIEKDCIKKCEAKLVNHNGILPAYKSAPLYHALKINYD